MAGRTARPNNRGGLGLRVVEEAARAASGRLWLRSEQPRDFKSGFRRSLRPSRPLPRAWHPGGRGPARPPAGLTLKEIHGTISACLHKT